MVGLWVVISFLLTSTNDTVSEAALLRFYSPDVQATLEFPFFCGTIDVATSSNLTRAAFGDLVQGLRTQFPQRQLIKEIFVVATPADPTNRTGAIMATHILSAVQDGQQLVLTVASLLRINWVQNEAWDQGGRRQVVTEALITNIVPYQGDEVINDHYTITGTSVKEFVDGDDIERTQTPGKSRFSGTVWISEEPTEVESEWVRNNLSAGVETSLRAGHHRRQGCRPIRKVKRMDIATVDQEHSHRFDLLNWAAN
ncbi:hypothetical protein B0H17DRAFT_1151219 [Mycena rosella]|uniref:Uncharacterized protein n=1 Tax=Mycena rosella TaxID=1033263 RepID=A0AAD7BMH4_MYCRO|nr:hypothetical protein B0H17DRAFT_1151219 [Mycena rosella]